MKRWFIKKTKRLIQYHEYDGSDTWAISLNFCESLILLALDWCMGLKAGISETIVSTPSNSSQGKFNKDIDWVGVIWHPNKKSKHCLDIVSVNIQA